MPAVSRKHQKFMYMCSTPRGRKKARGKCPPIKVAKKYRRMKK